MSSYDHTDHYRNCRRFVRDSGRVRPNEIQPHKGTIPNANTNTGGNGATAPNNGGTSSAETVASAGTETSADTDSVKTDGYARTKSIQTTANAGPDSGQTDTHTRASSGRQSLSRPPGCEFQRQKIPFYSEREGPGAYAVPRLGSKEYRQQHHFNVYRHEG